MLHRRTIDKRPESVAKPEVDRALAEQSPKEGLRITYTNLQKALEVPSLRS
jgi:hypothetical protein